MKKIVLLLFCIASNFIFTQENLLTRQAVDKKISEARQLSANNPGRSLAIFKETYSEAKQLNYIKGILESNKALMSLYYDIGDFKEVITLSKETEKHAKEYKDIAGLSGIVR